ncbi:hypothetical protein MD484_g4696, partial [Candolleomyces efflorescens]
MMASSVWLLLYFALNLALTLYNKLVLIHFPFPYTLTALHALCGSAGTFFLLSRRQVPSVQGKEAAVVAAFSVLYTVNIVVSNASLKLVTVPFHQCVRASAPLFTIALSAVLIPAYATSCAKLLSLIPVIVGVALATYGDYYFTPSGFLLTLLGTLLAALKTIVTNLLQQKKPLTRDQFLYPPLSVSGPFQFPKRTDLLRSFTKLPTNRPRPTHTSTASLIYTHAHTRFLALRHFQIPQLALTPLHLLSLLSPLAFIQTTALAYFTGELERVSWHLHDVALAAASGTSGTSSGSATGVSGSTLSGGGHAAWWGATLLPQFALGGGFGYTQRGLTESLAGLAGGLGGGMVSAPRFFLLLNGVLAFGLNVVSFEANRRVGAVGMSVAANVKQVLAVLFSVTLFNLSISSTNALGIALTIFGGGLYAYVGIQEKKSRIAFPPTASQLQTPVQTKHKVSGPIELLRAPPVPVPYPDIHLAPVCPSADEVDFEFLRSDRRRHRELGDAQV